MFLSDGIFSLPLHYYTTLLPFNLWAARQKNVNIQIYPVDWRWPNGIEEIQDCSKGIIDNLKKGVYISSEQRLKIVVMTKMLGKN